MDSNSTYTDNDTITAIATGVGGSISIIRISGPRALQAVMMIWQSSPALADAKPRRFLGGRIIDDDGTIVDECLAVYMPSPNSYTGEDIVELHCHGGLMVSRTVISLVMGHDVRHAEPGEFTKRAFLNGKIDLTQAEAVQDIISAQSQMALHAATRQLHGVLRRHVDTTYEKLTAVLAEIEVRMDFCDEDLDWKSMTQIEKELTSARDDIEQLLKQREDGEILQNGINIAIIGAPNAGKSSLLNLILGRDRAIVTDIPGTTRDTLEELAHIRGIPVKLIDTAGLRPTTDQIEIEGIARSRLTINHAHLVLWVIDSSKNFADQFIADDEVLRAKNLITIANKIDLITDSSLPTTITQPTVRLSALTGEGLEDLYDSVERTIWRHPHTESPEFAINARHSSLLEKTYDQLNNALKLITSEEYELIAVSVRATLDSLGKITGKTILPDILDNIFHKFCIGK